MGTGVERPGIDFDDRDRRDLASRGISLDEAERQLALLREPPAAMQLARPATVGDGIVRAETGEIEALAFLHDEAAREGRLQKFVPASGAATRMFQDLVAYLSASPSSSRPDLEKRARDGDREAAAVLTFLDGLGRFPFAGALREMLSQRGHDLDRLASDGDVATILDAMLSPEGLGYAEIPKGLLPFHRYEGAVRTAVEEHLVEASSLVRDVSGGCRVHFTVSSADRRRFESLIESLRPAYERSRGVRFDVELSEQAPGSDTLALERSGAPFRGPSGELILRPGGHGALLENLDGLEADLVHIKNVDNVAVEPRARAGLAWKKVLTGMLVRLRREAGERLHDVEGGSAAALEQAAVFASRAFGAQVADGPRRAAALLSLLRRPIRVCGVVPNTGEPGGGPFWVRGKDGRESLQIVEWAQLDRSVEQRRIFASSTHFNPVDMVCALRGADGRRVRLRDHVDPDAVILTWKTWGGRDLLALERPGLWNGGMADWNTVFVEIAATTFTPVKTVLDLLREEHQG